ncbi:hypothetical protein [Acetobacter thailandicus]|uniref:hypothetical protein n=1 Tax=Acetobacter thailandicus TaxID=1502842 RepID=UPI001BACAAB3|nr:hypothetical protein [Acetobacter thailandicus]MBS0961328.1 hypothetical protein [Acetobacter thailandicus]
MQRYDLFADAGAAANQFSRICEQKRRKGYVCRDFSSVSLETMKSEGNLTTSEGIE